MSTNRPIRNVLGVPGAIVADLLMQLFGMAALALLLPLAIWGWRLVTHRTLRRERIRLCFWIAGVLLAAACASSLPRTIAWPLPAGLGGVVGDWDAAPAGLLFRRRDVGGPASNSRHRMRNRRPDMLRHRGWDSDCAAAATQAKRTMLAEASRKVA